MADERLDDARLLHANRRHAAAYYLTGYAVECPLKACIAKQIKRHEYPPSPDFSSKLFSHSLDGLLKLAQLQDSRSSQERASPIFKANWAVVGAWKVDSRYEAMTRGEASALIRAVGDMPDVMLEWIKTHW